ncbi:MAG: glycoside hydrolase [Monoraphidium minutum]|nr:MAG: glycoside hydrolase [Monoraphidium minutum]
MAWFKLGLTIVDGIDTLMIAGLDAEYQEARHWIANHLHFPDQSTVQFFEVNIRIMGGLLSAYYLSGGDELFLHKAEALGDRLLPAFNTTSGLPVTKVQLKATSRERAAMARSDGQTNLAEAGTLSMEFTTLGRATGRPDFFNAGMIGWYALMGARNISGLYCVGLSTSRGDCYLHKLSVGSAADSMYEYMLKQWVMSNKTQEVPLRLYVDAMKGMRKYLVRDFSDGAADMSFVSEAMGDFNAGSVQATNDHFEHLTCFVGGMLVLGKWHGVSTAEPGDHDDLMLASRIGRACYELYHQAPSGLAPDSVRYHLANGANLPPNGRAAAASGRAGRGARGREGARRGAAAAGRRGRAEAAAALAAGAAAGPCSAGAARGGAGAGAAARRRFTPLSRQDFLRPEAAETLFYLWRATGDEVYREWGWNMFRAWERWCKCPTGGYATMESFWLAETLKYLFLLFEDDPAFLSFDEWVLNTEAHPFPIWGTAPDTTVSLE